MGAGASGRPALQNFAPSSLLLLIPLPPHHHLAFLSPTSLSLNSLGRGSMSFFGFDTTLPRDRDRGPGASKGFFENPDPFAEVARATALEDDDA